MCCLLILVAAWLCRQLLKHRRLIGIQSLYANEKETDKVILSNLCLQVFVLIMLTYKVELQLGRKAVYRNCKSWQHWTMDWCLNQKIRNENKSFNYNSVAPSGNFLPIADEAADYCIWAAKLQRRVLIQRDRLVQKGVLLQTLAQVTSWILPSSE